MSPRLISIVDAATIPDNSLTPLAGDALRAFLSE
jgi:hypothetical protein